MEGQKLAARRVPWKMQFLNFKYFVRCNLQFKQMPWKTQFIFRKAAGLQPTTLSTLSKKKFFFTSIFSTFW